MPGSGDYFYDLSRHKNPETGHLTNVAAEAVAQYKARLASGYALGYYFAEDSQRFFYDLDGCRNPETGQLTPIGNEAVNFFRCAGAYIEVSASGSGVHVVGRYLGPRPAHGTENKQFNLELYTADRGMAVGQYVEGNPDADCTGLLTQWLIPTYFPPSAAGPASTKDRSWTKVAASEWDGPTDDDELIRRFLAAAGSRDPNVFFGDKVKVTNQHLWDGDAKALTDWEAEPNRADGVTFNPTKADMALAGRLNFWTGNDYERTERLMYRSPYSKVRLDKWSDNVLVRETIPNAHAEQGPHTYQGPERAGR